MFRNLSVENLAVIAVALDKEAEIEDEKQKKRRFAVHPVNKKRKT
jgi:hypothetical protein